jgi:hypothetical protein
MKDLSKFGIDPKEQPLVEAYYQGLKGLLLTQVDGAVSRGLYLDLTALPTEPIDFKSVLIKWLIQINLSRINRGDPAIITLDILLKCPLWQAIKPPLKSIKLTKEALFNQPTIKTIGTKPLPGSINK